jgi:hypothetical protein
LSVNETPPGNVPVSARVGVGEPVEVTLNVPAAPAVKVVLLALVICGPAGTWAKAVETIAANTRHDISHDTAFR